MHIPDKRVCDLCRSELTGPYVVMSYPLDEADRAPLVEAMRADLPEPLRMFERLIDVTPKSWRFDFCRGCADGFMPMLAELKTAAVKAWLAERAKKAAAPIGSEAD
jgi:hypothetical protein